MNKFSGSSAAAAAKAKAAVHPSAPGVMSRMMIRTAVDNAFVCAQGANVLAKWLSPLLSMAVAGAFVATFIIALITRDYHRLAAFLIE